MASCPGHGQVEPAKMEQIITEFFAKTLHIILESRCPFVSSRNYSGEQIVSSPASSSSSSSSIRLRDKWFNLALRECPAALENIDFWRQGNLEPMVIDVVLVQRSSDWDPLTCSPQRRGLVKNLSLKERFPDFLNSDSDEFGCEAKTEKIIERWIVQYESRGRDSVSGSKRLSSPSSHTLYKKSILLLRSLYTMVRLLPAYKLFRDLNSSGQILTYNLAHRVSSFAEPFTRQEDSEFQHFTFTPVDTLCGRLCLSVFYRSSLLDVSSEPSTPMTPQLISDYVGSPLAEPLKRFPSMPSGFPSTSPFSRRHSWSHDLYGASPPSALPSPSPTYSDSRASISKPNSQRPPPSSLPHQFPEIPQLQRRNAYLDDCWPSSPSPSPSPPAYAPGGHISKVLLRCESAPVNIPTSKFYATPASDNRHNLPPSSPRKGTRPVGSRIERSSGLVQTSSTVEKLLSSGKDDTVRHSGAKPYSYSSANKSFSNSSRRSFDDFDDYEYSGHFVVDEDDDMINATSRPESFDQRDQADSGGTLQSRKSQDAAVGALVRMLRKAPPLRQDTANSTSLSKSPNPKATDDGVAEKKEMFFQPSVQNTVSSSSISSSAHIVPKTTADALEDLRSFKDIKELLLSKGAGPDT